MELIKREITFRATQDAEKREITGIGVPYNTEVAIWDDLHEQFAPGSVDATGAILRYAHREPIGAITATRDTDTGFEVTARISHTQRGDEVWQLVKDGVLNRMSIGFEPITKTVEESDDGVEHVTWTKVKAREFSIVEFPAYPTAEITNHRSKKEKEMTDTTAPAIDLAPLTDRLDTLERSIATLGERDNTPALPAFRTFGEYVLAMKRGDDGAKALQRAAYTTAAYEQLPAPWLGVLHKRMTAKQPVCEMFTRTPLPKEGMTIEYAKKADAGTIQVAKQAQEGAELVTGQPGTWTVESAKVETYGGVADNITRQVIERTTAPNVLDEIFTDLAFQYALAIEKAMQAELAGAITKAEETPTHTLENVDAITADTLLDTLLALSDAYEETPYLMDGLVVSPAVFQKLLHLPAKDKALQLVGAPDTRIGTITLAQPGKADVGTQWTLRRGKFLTGNKMVAYSKEALVLAESPGAPMRLQNDNIHNLTKDFAVYGYAATYAPHADLIKAVKFTA